jgi:hypothetical protein
MGELLGVSHCGLMMVPIKFVADPNPSLLLIISLYLLLFPIYAMEMPRLIGLNRRLFGSPGRESVSRHSVARRGMDAKTD